MSGRPFTLVDQFFVSCLWFAYNLQWGALLFLVVPSQVENLVGAGSKEKAMGFVLAAGAFVSLVITPIAGSLSDRVVGPRGRRKPFLISGVLVNCVCLALMAGFSSGQSIWLYGLCFLGVQFGCNWWGGPYAGLIPDVVPKNKVGQASGFQALMTATGIVLGAVVANLAMAPGVYWRVYAAIILVLIVMLLLTVIGVREPPAEPLPAQSFFPDLRANANFYWVLVTRCIISLGVYSISPYFLYFLQDVVKAPDPEAATAVLMVIIIGMGIPTSIWAGVLSDRTGRKPLVYASGAIMAAACAVYIGVTFSPSLGATYAVAAFYGLGNGAFQAVDWALAVDVLPKNGGPAKDMGIWHVALVLPQVIGPAMTGMIVGAVKGYSLLLGYTAVFVLAAVWFTLGTVLVRNVRGVR